LETDRDFLRQRKLFVEREPVSDGNAAARYAVRPLRFPVVEKQRAVLRDHQAGGKFVCLKLPVSNVGRLRNAAGRQHCDVIQRRDHAGHQIRVAVEEGQI